jgi:anthranilate phosphoribosyltransferase
MIDSKVKALLDKLLLGDSLLSEEAYSFLNEVMKGNVSEIILASFLTALKIKGETRDELQGFVRAMRENADKPTSKFDFDFIDTCGTGGDGKGTFNVSTLSAFTLAALGVKVAKHGNRSVSSLSGSSDILQSIGYPLDRGHEASTDEFLKTGFTFLFAPAWHPSMKYAGPVRRELGFRTFFNLIGPLSNPFSPTHQIVGVYDPGLLEVLSEVLQSLGSKKNIVCHSKDGLDEFSIFAPTDYVYFDGKNTQKLVLDPKSIPDMNPPIESQVFAKNAEESLQLFKQVLQGESTSGTDMVALNAGAALFLMGKSDSLPAGFTLAKNALLSKKVLEFVGETLNLSQLVKSLDK